MRDDVFDNIKDVDLKKTMETSYIDYAMSVIAARALPDVRDGMKPVQRRILYSMVELNNTPDKPHRKSARIVGDAMGKYHPHGDSSIYGALVNMAQDWNMRYTLVDGHGNFGSVDGDGAAAMRYTEARLSKISMEMIRDLGKDTVNFVPNFDETEKEPTVLPARFPNLLVNGTTGIAVGMATNIPPHNLGEVIDGVVKIIDDNIQDKDTDIRELLDIIKGPDFPTGARIYGTSGITESYLTGRGKIKTRAIANIETNSSGKSKIVVTELPYMVNKARLVEKIAELARDKKIDGITGVNDYSDREGNRIVVDIRRDANANVILNQLYKMTQMQETFGVINLALDNGEPKVMNLKQLLVAYLKHQEDVVTRRCKYDLNKAEERAHILQGLIIALDNIDEVIKLIRAAANTQEAKEALIKAFNLTEAQAQAIVDMRLRALTGLERKKIEDELKELEKQILYLKEILGDHKKLLGLIKEEITEIKNKYADPRKTQIEIDAAEIENEDLIPKKDIVVTMTKLGYIKRMEPDLFKAQGRGGKGIKGMQTLEDDYIEEMFIMNSHEYIMLFTNKGRCYRLKGYEIPEASRTSRGVAIVNLLQLMKDETITALIPFKEYDENKYLLTATRKGLVKKTSLMEYSHVRKTGLAAIKLRDDDELISVKISDGTSELLCTSRKGLLIRFKEKDVRPTGRNTSGVIAMRLASDDELISMQMNSQGSDMLLVSEKGLGKRTNIEEFHVQGRGGKGVRCYKISEKTGDLVGAILVEEENEIMIINTEGIIIRVKSSDISKIGRNTSGVRVIKLKSEDEKVARVTKVKETEIEESEQTEEINL